MVSTVRPKARETPTRLMPMLYCVPSSLAPKSAARTALPQPPNTSQKVPMNSAARRLERGMGFLWGVEEVSPPTLDCGTRVVPSKKPFYENGVGVKWREGNKQGEPPAP